MHFIQMETAIWSNYSLLVENGSMGPIFIDGRKLSLYNVIKIKFALNIYI